MLLVMMEPLIMIKDILSFLYKENLSQKIITATRTVLQSAQAVEGQPVVAVIHASIDFLAYNGGIFSGSCSRSPDDGNYSVLVVGYTSTYWRVRTAFGPTWGERGYARLPKYVNSCGIGNWGSYPVINGECHSLVSDFLLYGTLADSAVHMWFKLWHTGNFFNFFFLLHWNYGGVAITESGLLLGSQAM